MATILIANSYFYRLDAKQWKDGRPYPPYGTLLAAAVLREAGHDVHVFDACLSESPDDLQPLLERVKPSILVIYDDGFNYLTKMCLTVMRDAAFRMIDLGKAANCKVAVNSSDATDHAANYLNAGADIVLQGEGEITLKEVAEHWGNNAVWKDLAGIRYAENSVVNVNPKRPILRELDIFPLPAWDLIDIAPYKKIWTDSNGIFSLNLATTRGCPFKCNWCAKPIYGNRYNSRSPEHVVNELELLLTNYSPDHFWFADDIFGLKPGWVQRFRDILEKRNLKIRYKIQSRADLLLENNTIDALVGSGLEEVWIGAESGSQRILDAMDKGTTVEQIAEATHLLRSKGVRVCFFLQFGYLGETQEEVEQTINMVETLMPDDIGVSISYPLPGTKFYETVKADMDKKANWSDSDDLAMMFRNQQAPAYYKRLHRYVHKRYRKEQAMRMWKGVDRFLPMRAVSALYYVPATTVEGIRLRSLITA